MAQSNSAAVCSNTVAVDLRTLLSNSRWEQCVKNFWETGEQRKIFLSDQFNQTKVWLNGQSLHICGKHYCSPYEITDTETIVTRLIETCTLEELSELYANLQTFID